MLGREIESKAVKIIEKDKFMDDVIYLKSVSCKKVHIPREKKSNFDRYSTE